MSHVRALLLRRHRVALAPRCGVGVRAELRVRSERASSRGSTVSRSSRAKCETADARIHLVNKTADRQTFVVTYRKPKSGIAYVHHSADTHRARLAREHLSSRFSPQLPQAENMKPGIEAGASRSRWRATKEAQRVLASSEAPFVGPGNLTDSLRVRTSRSRRSCGPARGIRSRATSSRQHPCQSCHRR